MIIPDVTNFHGAQFKEMHFIKHYPEFYNYIIENYPDKPVKFIEKIYWYFNKLNDYPRCPVCGGIPTFINFVEGYRKYCSKSCLNSDPEKVEKTKKTCIEKYGGVAPCCNNIIKEKSKRTCIERYGVENIMQSPEYKQKIFSTIKERYGGVGNQSKQIKEKHDKTCIEKYGVANITQNKEIYARIVSIFKEKYGVTNPLGLGIEKLKETKLKQSMDKYPDIIGIDGDLWICKCPHPECQMCKEKTYLSPRNIHRCRHRDGTELCTKILPVGDASRSSSYEYAIRLFLDSIGLEYETNIRNIIPPKELDIYIPSKSLAIEINGCYWHSDKEKPKKYHLDKFLECKAKGIQLIQIWEDWLIHKPEIVRSILLNKLGLTPNRIYARECQIREVSTKDATKFLDANHIQGRSQSMVRLGLYYEDQLVSLMTFGPKRACMGDSKGDIMGYELVRFCNILNTNIVGGASKLLKEFIRQYSPKYIISYSSNDISFGNLYNTLGFESGEVSTSYWYIEPETMHRYHRSSFSRSGIARKFGYDIKDMSWSEHNVMDELGYIRIYDAGTTRWVLECDE